MNISIVQVYSCKVLKQRTLPFFPIAFPSSLYSTNHHGFVVVGTGVVVVVGADVVVVVVVVVEVVGAGVTATKLAER